MRIILTMIFALITSHLACASTDTYQALCDGLEAAVRTSAQGDFRSALRAVDLLGQQPMGPKQSSADAERNKAMFEKFSDFGPLDEIEQVSLVFTGKSFFRVKFVEKREKGVVLWTFIGYKYKNQWYCKSLSVTGSPDLADLMAKNMDPADGQPPPKE